MNKQNIQLYLDLGSKTGYAIYGDVFLESGTKLFKNDKFSGAGMRFLDFKNWLISLKNKFDSIESIYFEGVRAHSAVDAAHVYGGFLAILTSFSEENSIPYKGIPVGTIKKFISGRGNANKEMVIESVKTKGFLPKDDNEADAISLMLYIKSLED